MGHRKKSERSLPAPLVSKDVFRGCSLSNFSFRSTRSVRSKDEIIAQEQALAALEFGLGVKQPGYHIYVSGPPGTGQMGVIRSFLEKFVTHTQAPQDWVYVYNFEKKYEPQIIGFPTGEGAVFANMMEESIREMKDHLHHAFSSSDYENAVNQHFSEMSDEESKQFSTLEKVAREHGFQIRTSKTGMESVPVVGGRALSEKEYSRLGDEDRRKIEQNRTDLDVEMLQFARSVRHMEEDSRRFVSDLQIEIASQIVDICLESIFTQYSKTPQIPGYLEDIKTDILKNIDLFMEDSAEQSAQQHTHDMHQDRDAKLHMRRYAVNLFVDHRKTQTAPVVVESNPTYYNLFGKIEKQVDSGLYSTDFTMIQAGAIHRANGGYLLVNAEDILRLPSAWETLKRLLRHQQGFIEDLGEQVALLPTSGLKPQPLDLDVKVIMIGNEDLYHLLFEMDEDFSRVFRVKSEFREKMPWNSKGLRAYTEFVSTRCEREGLRAFHKSAMASLVEYGSRLAEDREYLSTRFSQLKSVCIEADYIAGQRSAKQVLREDVEQALDQQVQRVNRVELETLEMMKQNQLMFSFRGKKVGQVHGLMVCDYGDHQFGRPGRITCSAYVNDEGIINVERASRMSGRIHDKGMYILTGFLNSYLARDRAMGLSASIVFEQSYGGVDGDSATTAELTAIVSAMSGVAIDQSFAMTGSLNQLGEVQPVGGINEKLEGFYSAWETLEGRRKGAVCRVVIPESNVRHLVLYGAAKEAIESGRMEVYPAQYFWQVFELATGVPFGAQEMHVLEFEEGSALSSIAQRLDGLEEREDHKMMPPQVSERHMPEMSARTKS
ncbi:MAG: AAA family ATPase [Oligoflexales bacterium]